MTRMGRVPARKPRTRGTPDRPDRSVRAAQERWRSKNEQAIEQYNAFVERHGVFSDDFRQF
jgi:Post-segregation antitoxin CcdA